MFALGCAYTFITLWLPGLICMLTGELFLLLNYLNGPQIEYEYGTLQMLSCDSPARRDIGTGQVYAKLKYVNKGNWSEIDKQFHHEFKPTER